MKRFFPRKSNRNRKGVLRLGRGGKLLSIFVVRTSAGMLVNRGRAGVEPMAWRTPAIRDGTSDGQRRVHSRLQNFTAILFRVTAIHRASRQIDDRVGILDFPNPFSC